MKLTEFLTADDTDEEYSCLNIKLPDFWQYKNGKSVTHHGNDNY